MKRLVDIGENGTATYRTPVATINKSGNIFLDGNYYVQNYIVTANVDIESFTAIITRFPTGTILTSTSGTAKNTFNKGETFQVRIPKATLGTSDINGQIRVEVNTKSYPILFRTNI